MDIAEGLWALNAELIVDPQTVVFPSNCLFTGEPVDCLTKMTLAQVQASNRGILTTCKKQEVELAIPISENYRQSRASKCKTLQKALFGLGLAVIAVGIAASLSLELSNDVKGGAIATVLGVGGLALIVGACLPYLDDMNGSKYLSGVTFLDDGKILIPKVHPRILENLPKLKKGFTHGVLGRVSLHAA